MRKAPSRGVGPASDGLSRLPQLAALAAVLLAAACSSSSSSHDADLDDTPTPADDGADVRGEEAGEADADEEDVGEVEDVSPDASDVPCGPNPWVYDPSSGPVGRPCDEPADCEFGTSCWTLADAHDLFCSGPAPEPIPPGRCIVWDDDPGPGISCAPDDPATCPEGSRCIFMGRQESTGLEYFGCMPACSVASLDGVPWTDNGGCPAGYACDLSNEVCGQGCCSDAECCEIWHDGEGGTRDGIRQPGEVTVLPPERCVDTCSSCTFACERRGCVGGDCAIGDPCEHDSDCPALGRCISDYQTDGRFAGGLCIQDRCDLVGRECPVGSGCADLGSSRMPWTLCVMPCTAATQPGDAGFPCRDVAPPGPSVGDYACHPLRGEDWVDGLTAEDGFCWEGNFGGDGSSMFSACTDDPECESPFGLGVCVRLVDTPKFCSAACNRVVAETGACGAADPGSGIATGVCAAQLCVQACDPAAAPTGCTGAATACYPIAGFGPGTDSFIAAGATMPAGVCWPRCADDAWCLEMWDSGTCDTLTGVCTFT
jgi:hypothetical protein